MSNRVDVIDIAKGISILLVVLGHSEFSNMWYGGNVLLGLFRMPLFFFLVGVFFSPKGSAAVFLIKKSDALLKPYFVTLLSLLLVEYGLGGRDFFSGLVGVFFGNGKTIEWTAMWFLTHLWLLFGAAYLIYTALAIQKFSGAAKVVFLGALFAWAAVSVGFFWQANVRLNGVDYFLPGLPFSADLLPITLAYFFLGQFMREKVINFTMNYCLFFIALLGFVLVGLYGEAKLDLNRRVFTNPLLAVTAALCAIYLVMSLAKWLSEVFWLGAVLKYFGMASLFVLIFHMPVEQGLHRLGVEFLANQPYFYW
jgi:fucose 4-O-acetylase-like acetyltransferase